MQVHKDMTSSLWLDGEFIGKAADLPRAREQEAFIIRHTVEELSEQQEYFALSFMVTPQQCTDTVRLLEGMREQSRKLLSLISGRGTMSGPLSLICALTDVETKARALIVETTVFSHKCFDYDRRSTIGQQLLLSDELLALVRTGRKILRHYDEMVLRNHPSTDESLMGKRGALVSRYLLSGLSISDAVRRVEDMSLEG